VEAGSLPVSCRHRQLLLRLVRSDPAFFCYSITEKVFMRLRRIVTTKSIARLKRGLRCEGTSYLAGNSASMPEKGLSKMRPVHWQAETTKGSELGGFATTLATTLAWRMILPVEPSVRLILLLLQSDLRLFCSCMNSGDSRKSKMRVDNKRHTGAHQPWPPTHQVGIQSLLLRHFSKIPA